MTHAHGLRLVEPRHEQVDGAIERNAGCGDDADGEHPDGHRMGLVYLPEPIVEPVGVLGKVDGTEQDGQAEHDEADQRQGQGDGTEDEQNLQQHAEHAQTAVHTAFGIALLWFRGCSSRGLLVQFVGQVLRVYLLAFHTQAILRTLCQWNEEGEQDVGDDE